MKGITEKICCCTAVLAMSIVLASCSNSKIQESINTVVKVDTVKVHYGTKTIKFPGKVKPAMESNLAFQVPGTLQHVYVQEGTRVKKGTVLASLDERDYRTQLNAVEAEYNQIKAEADRVIAMYKDSAVTALNYDKARYGLQQITAKYKNCKDQLEDTRLKAPFDGVVRKCFYDAPAVVGAGMPVIGIISDGHMEIEINIPASEYARLSEYTGYKASFDCLPEGSFPLQIIGISPKANSNQLYKVRFGISGKTDGIAAGMNTVVSMDYIRGNISEFIVPSTAVFSRNGKSFVWKLSDNQVVRLCEVQVERLLEDGSAIIKSVMEPKALIVTAGIHHIQDGEKVDIINAPSASNIGGLL